MTKQEQKDWTENVRWADDRQDLRYGFAKYDRDNRVMDRVFVMALIFAMLGLAGIVGCVLMIFT